MEFQIDADEFRLALSAFKACGRDQATMSEPLVRLITNADEGSVQIASSASVETPTTVTIKGGDTVPTASGVAFVSLATLTAVAAQAPSDRKVTAAFDETTDDDVRITWADAKFKLWAVGEHDTWQQPARVEGPKGVAVDATDMLNWVQQVSIAVAGAAAQPGSWLTYLMFDAQDNQLVASDSFRTAVQTFPIDGVLPGDDVTLVTPVNLLNALRWAVKQEGAQVQLQVSKMRFGVHIDASPVNAMFSVKVSDLETSLDSIRKLCGAAVEKSTESITVGQPQLRDAIAASRAIADQFPMKSKRPIECVPTETHLQLSAEYDEVGSSNVQVPIIASVGERRNVRFSSKYLADAVNSVQDTELTVSWSNDRQQPLTVFEGGNDDGYRHFVMPLAYSR